jgi:DNA-binding NarL/FixJ family response regulator
MDDAVLQKFDLIQHEQASLPVRESMIGESPAAQQRALKILLIENDPIDAAWITELIHEKGLGAEVAHSACLSQALLVLAQQPTDAVFVSIHPDGGLASSEICRELVSKANGRPVVALVDVAERDHVADIHATGVRFIYGKHPIMRTAHVRKLEARERFRARITEHP